MEELFRKYYTSLCYFSYTLTQDRALAEDIVQTVFVRFWETNKEENIRNGKSWLYTAVRNATLNEMDKQQTYLQMKEKLSISHIRNSKSEKDIGILLIESETARQLWGRVNELPPQCRQIMRLYFIEGLSNTEIANRLQLHISTIKTQKQRGIAYLRKIIQLISIFISLTLIKK